MVTSDRRLNAVARALLARLRSRRLKVAAAESCTGGLVVATLTEIPGSSDVVERGFITYSNPAKQQMLGVPASTLAKFGAVSRETALAMAEGALKRSQADISVAITGIAGPAGGSRQKPVGLVHIAAAARQHPPLHREFRFGRIGRAEVRKRSVLEAFAMIRALANQRRARAARRK
jgi:nicotinamide-nucleotide amidase